MIIDEDPLRGLLFYQDLSFSHILHLLKATHVRSDHWSNLTTLDSAL